MSWMTRAVTARWRRAGLGGLLAGALMVAGGCEESKPAPDLRSLAPQPLPNIVAMEGNPSSVLPITPRGERLPASARVLHLSAASLEGGGLTQEVAALEGEATVVLRPDAEVYLAQAAPLLAALADSGAKVWLAHPEGEFGYRLLLFDEAAYQHWIDLPEPGRLRVVMRGDGYELTTSVGKLPGPDRNGPSVPLRQGRHDLGRLRLAFEALLDRFSTEDMICWVPSFGMELQTVARSLSATYEEDGDPMLKRQCLVFPRPK